jgi:hypothetical protein
MMMTKVTWIVVPVITAAAIARAGAQQHPVMDMVADRLIQKYQTASCEQLWQERSEKQNQPKTQQQQEAITMLQNHPQMRAAFINRVAAPIANKLFDCGMIP